MQLNNLVLDAVDTVLNLDLSDEAYPEAVNAQVCNLAGLDTDDQYAWGGHAWGGHAWAYDVSRRVH